MRTYDFYVYILASKRNSILYIGVTNNLWRRLEEHRTKRNKSFTSKYNVDKLVYFENYKYIDQAILREKRLKKWKREWKNELITKVNPKWKNLAEDLPKIPVFTGMTIQNSKIIVKKEI